jgi:Predicted hydrolases or acyltransferases (alpha/beta hydrolase superfamily)
MHTPDTLAQLEASAHRSQVAYRDRGVCWRRWGQGPALVLIHGGHGSWMHWVRNIAALARHFTVLVPDLPGFGDSDDLGHDAHSPDRMDHLIDALSATLDTMLGRHAPVCVAGFSFGGLVAAELAARRGGVRKLALIGPAGHGGVRRQKVDLVDWRTPDPAQRRARLRHNLAALMLHDPAAIDELAMAVHEASCVRTRFRSKALSRTNGLHGALERYAHPALLIWGEHDVTAVPDEVASQLAQLGPDREWCVIPGGGHWVQYERSHDVNQLLKAWFLSQEGDMQ